MRQPRDNNRAEKEFLTRSYLCQHTELPLQAVLVIWKIRGLQLKYPTYIHLLSLVPDQKLPLNGNIDQVAVVVGGGGRWKKNSAPAPASSRPPSIMQ